MKKTKKAPHFMGENLTPEPKCSDTMKPEERATDLHTQIEEEENSRRRLYTTHETFPWDTVPVWVPTWGQIKDRAHHYVSARRRDNGKYVRVKLVAADTFRVAKPEEGKEVDYMSTKQLCAFCL